MSQEKEYYYQVYGTYTLPTGDKIRELLKELKSYQEAEKYTKEEKQAKFFYDELSIVLSIN